MLTEKLLYLDVLAAAARTQERSPPHEFLYR
jgi:hypothetical protein